MTPVHPHILLHLVFVLYTYINIVVVYIVVVNCNNKRLSSTSTGKYALIMIISADSLTC